jgi:hypothetical protein
MLFEHFEAPQVISMAPTSGFAGVPTAIRLVIARFPVVASAAQLSVQIGVGLDVVSGVAELLSSEPASTEILVMTLSERFNFSDFTSLPSTFSIPFTVTPLNSATEKDRNERQVKFDFQFIRPSAQVLSVSPSVIPQLSQQLLVLQVESFQIVSRAQDVTVLFGHVRTPITKLVSSDVELTIIQVQTDRLTSQDAVYTCSIEYGSGGSSTTSAGFVIQVQDTTFELLWVDPASGPSTGHTKMVVEFAGAVMPYSTDDVVIRFGDSSLSFLAQAIELNDDGITSRLTIFVPSYSGPSEDGRASMYVRIFVRQEPTVAVKFIYTYLTELRVESAVLSADGATFDVRLGQPANISPNPDQVLSQAVGIDGLGGSDGLGTTLATGCAAIFLSSTIDMLGMNHSALLCHHDMCTFCWDTGALFGRLLKAAFMLAFSQRIRGRP